MSQHDHAERRRAQRHGREKGCRVYIPGEVLERLGYPVGTPAPFYRVWSGPRGGCVVQFYRQATA